jgi:hypothetical protein
MWLSRLSLGSLRVVAVAQRMKGLTLSALRRRQTM